MNTRIPSTFDLMAHTITVEWVDGEIPGEPNANAVNYPDQLRVVMSRAPRPDSIVLHDFYHELVHLVFSFAGREDLSADESLVNNVSGLLQQAAGSAKFA